MNTSVFGATDCSNWTYGSAPREVLAFARIRGGSHEAAKLLNAAPAATHVAGGQRTVWEWGYTIHTAGAGRFLADCNRAPAQASSSASNGGTGGTV